MPLICSGCGCTNEQACPGGCSWVSTNPPVCSACVEGTFADGAEIDDSGFICRAAPIPAPHKPLWTDAHSCHCAACGERLAA